MNDTIYDVCIIGAGAVGGAIARELSAYKLSVLALEKENDVACGATKANSGIIHSGFVAAPGSRKAEFCRQGNQLFDRLDRELQFGFRRPGSLVLACSEEEEETLGELVRRGRENGVEGLSILNREAVLDKEPQVAPVVRSALWAPDTGFIIPFEYAIALWENAVANGVNLHLTTRVSAVSRVNDRFSIRAGQTEYQARFVINAAGIHSADLARNVTDPGFYPAPRRGEFILFNKRHSPTPQHILFPVPGKKGKGILVTPTRCGNLMLGPSAEDIESLDDTSTHRNVLTSVYQQARKLWPGIDLRFALRTYAGIRPAASTHDFEIRMDNGFLTMGGIESPGLTASYALARHALELCAREGLPLHPKAEYHPHRSAVISCGNNFDQKEVQRRLDSSNPKERLICRCEQVLEQSVTAALSGELPIVSLDAVKRRTRAGMGFCQGKFCGERIRPLVAQRNGSNAEQISRRGPGSSEPVRITPEQLRRAVEK